VEMMLFGDFKLMIAERQLRNNKISVGFMMGD